MTPHESWPDRRSWTWTVCGPIQSPALGWSVAPQLMEQFAMPFPVYLPHGHHALSESIVTWHAELVDSVPPEVRLIASINLAQVK
jgi:hypothetical protein